MKKRIAIIGLVLTFVLLLVGCAPKVDTLNSWHFQYNEGTGDYSLFFGFSDSKGKALAADATVEIRIVNDAGEEVYNEVREVTQDDFGTYSSLIGGEQVLANVRIPASDITKGKSSNGTVYFKVYNGSSFAFDEANCEALYCLPVEDFQLNANVPVEITCYDYNKNPMSGILIEEVSYTVSNGISTSVTIEIKGSKTYGDSSGMSCDIVTYKINDSQGYMIDDGELFLSNMNAGDKFKEERYLYDVTPGEVYTITFSEYTR